MKDIEKKVQDLLAQMTLEEKIGQTRQCGPSLVGAFDVSFEELLNMMFDGKISKEKFDELLAGAHQDLKEDDIRAGRIGSFNGVKGADQVRTIQKIAMEESRLGIPLIIGSDVIHGYRTITPIPLGESCAWEPSLWERTARISAKEAAADGIKWTFAPMVDVAKDARWGRVSEGAGEDALLNGVYGAAKVRGFQTDDPTAKDAIAACVKHFAAYGAVEAGRDYNRVDMSEQKLREEYLPSYKASVEAGALTVMPAFNDISGVPCSCNKQLLTDILRGEWGFKGFTISDANAIAELVNHGAAADNAEAAAKAMNAGMDMDMTSEAYIENLKKLIEDGIVSEETLDKAVADILRVKFELGLFDDPFYMADDPESCFLLPEYRELAREAAQKSIVLLKNDDILPLRPGTHIGLCGDLAGIRAEMTGTWSISANGEDCVSLVDACKAQGVPYTFFKTDLTEGENEEKTTAAGNSESDIHIGADILTEACGENSRHSFEAMAEACDVFVAAIGERKDDSGEAASRSSIEIAPEQIAMLERLLATGKPVIVVIFNGRPLALTWVKENVPAILEAWHPGVEAGNAILDILFGVVNPSAKLTTSFPYSAGTCPTYYDHINTGRPGGRAKFTSKYLDAPLTPVFPFGFGLSYTTYAYSNLAAEVVPEGIRGSVCVTNEGKVAGDEIVQIYFRDPVAERVRPVRKLAAFEKIFLKPGETKEVSFLIKKEQLGYYTSRMEFVVDEGEIEVYAGGNSVDTLKTVCRI